RSPLVTGVQTSALPISGPRLDPLRVEGSHLLERLEGLSWASVIQEDIAFREPWFRIIPSKGDGAVVVLDGRTPTAFPLKERSLRSEERRVGKVWWTQRM